MSREGNRPSSWRACGSSLGAGSFVLGAAGGGSHLCQPRICVGPIPSRINLPSGNEQYLKEAVKRMVAGQPLSPAEMAQNRCPTMTSSQCRRIQWGPVSLWGGD